MATNEQRVAIVTGGGSGIGLAIVERLARDGAAVAIFDRDGESAEAAAGKVVAGGGRALAAAVDVTHRDAVDDAVARTAADLGAPTILVNNAGLDGFEPFLDISVESWQRIFDVNVTGTFHCCQAVVPHMVEAAWGRIVNISSSSAQSGAVMMTHYSASKGAVISFTRSLALELGPKGITVNTIPPGFIDTPMLRKAESRGFLGGGVEENAKRTPVRRAGRPEDIAAACAFLVSEDAGYVTGQVIGVNGGRNP